MLSTQHVLTGTTNQIAGGRWWKLGFFDLLTPEYNNFSLFLPEQDIL